MTDFLMNGILRSFRKMRMNKGSGQDPAIGFCLLLRSNSSTGAAPSSSYVGEPLPVSHETQWSEADYEKHFNDHGKWGQFLALPSAEGTHPPVSVTP